MKGRREGKGREARAVEAGCSRQEWGRGAERKGEGERAREAGAWWAGGRGKDG